jgi:colicin import membrane protein
MADAKQTPVTSTVAKMEGERLAQEKRTDERAAKEEIPAGLVLVRLTRSCFDSTGVLHSAEDPALLLPGDVPTSAKIIALGKGVRPEDFSTGFILARKAEADLADARADEKAKALGRIAEDAVTDSKVDDDDDDDDLAAKKKAEEEDAAKTAADTDAAAKSEAAKKAAAETAAKK